METKTRQTTNQFDDAITRLQSVLVVGISKIKDLLHSLKKDRRVELEVNEWLVGNI